MRILLFGRLRDAAGTSTVRLETTARTVDDAISALVKIYPELKVILASPCIHVAVNGKLVRDGMAPIDEGDEVAFMPPLSGG